MGDKGYQTRNMYMICVGYGTLQQVDTHLVFIFKDTICISFIY